MRPRSLAAALAAIALVGVGSGAGTSDPRPITIGVLSDCIGPFATQYAATLAGVELPLIERGARLAGSDPADGLTGASVAGHPVRLVLGCTDGGSTSNLVEARRLVEGDGAQVVIGPLQDHAEIALQAYARRRPGVTFVNGTGAAQLLDPAPNFFNFLSDGAEWMAGLGSYAYRRLGWREAVVVANPDLFEWTVAAGFEAEFCSLGGRIAKRIWTWNDVASMLEQVPRGRVDGFFLATTGYYDPLEVALAKYYPGLRGKVARRLLGGIGLSQAWPVLRERVRGQVFAGTVNTESNAAKPPADFLKAFPKLAGSFNTDELFVYPYGDAMTATLEALLAVHGDLTHSERRFQAALARVQLDSSRGHIRLGAHHQAISPNYLWRLERLKGSKTTLIRTIPSVEPTFGGYFTAHDPPPRETTPACVKRTPPPWARSG